MKHITIDTPIDEMDEDSLRATFSDVMAAHEENVTEMETLTADFADLEETLEGEREKTATVAGYFAEKATEVTSLDTDLLVDRFSLDELMGMAARADEQAAEFTEESVEDDVDGADEDATIFADREDRAPITEETQADFSDEARGRLSRIPGLSFD